MKKKDVVSGSEYPTNSGDTVIILRYLGCEDVIVTFKDANTPQNFEMKVTMQAIRKGQVRNPYRKTKIVRLMGSQCTYDAYKGVVDRERLH